jgi:hypothetical protein
MNAHRLLSLFAACTAFVFAATAYAGSPYTEAAGQNAPAAAVVQKRVVDKDGTAKVVQERVQGPVVKDSYGNAQGNQYDLARDGAFDGQTVAVLHFCLEFDFALPKAALAEKGFSTFRWVGTAPSVEELEEGLKKANQLWIISSTTRRLSDAHIAVIKRYFDAGHGVYIWGDNDPYYADANAVGRALLDVEMHGDVPGGHPVPIQSKKDGPGVRPNHLLTTGLESVYEGITIATIDTNQHLTPIIWGSAGNIVTSAYEKNGKRALFDGGFTRLYNGWDTAGTPRYVKNAAAWLANVERFGDKVTAQKNDKNVKSDKKTTSAMRE